MRNERNDPHNQTHQSHDSESRHSADLWTLLQWLVRTEQEQRNTSPRTRTMLKILPTLLSQPQLEEDSRYDESSRVVELHDRILKPLRESTFALCSARHPYCYYLVLDLVAGFRLHFLRLWRFSRRRRDESRVARSRDVPVFECVCVFMRRVT